MAETMEEDDETEAAGETGKKGSKKKLVLIIALALLLAVGAAVALYFSGVFRSSPSPEAPPEASAPAPKAAEPAGAASPGGQTAVFYDLPEMLLDINSAGRKRNYLKIRISLELTSAADIPAIQAVMPRILDNFQVYLREMRVEDFQGAEGLYRLREELLIRVNSAVRPVKINDVLFKEMLIQ